MDVKHAEEMYLRIKDKLKGQKGKMVAIDVDSGDYFVGDSPLEACDLGKKKYPGKIFYLKRIGAKYTFVVGS